MISGRRLAAVTLLFALQSSVEVRAQEPRSSVLGLIVSRYTLQPVEGARILLRRWVAGAESSFDTSFAVDSDKDGRFRFDKLRAGRYVIEAWHAADTLPPTPLDLGRSERLEVELTVGRILGTVPVLPDINVEGKAPSRYARRDDFARRMEAASLVGQVITREMIEARNAPTFVDLLRMASGVEVRCRGGQCLPRMVRSLPGCPGPQVVLDGAGTDVRVLGAILPQEVEGVEIYNGLSEAPLELVKDTRLARCGVIVIWTRGGLEPAPRPPGGAASP